MTTTSETAPQWNDDAWRDQAACRLASAALFFPIGTTGAAVEQIESAKKICQRCPVAAPCLEFALQTKQEDGIWGGTDEDERRRLRRAWRAGRRRLAQASLAG